MYSDVIGSYMQIRNASFNADNNYNNSVYSEMFTMKEMCMLT